MLASKRLLSSAGRSAAVAASLCLPANLDAANLGKVATRGKIILQEKCGRCHAIEAVGESPLKQGDRRGGTRKAGVNRFTSLCDCFGYCVWVVAHLGGKSDCARQSTFLGDRNRCRLLH